MSLEWKEKKELRKTCAAIRNGMDPLVRQQASEKICTHLEALSCYRFASTLLFYMPIGSEADISPLVEKALAGGRLVGLPRCEKEPGVMTFRRVGSLSELAVDSYGIREPSSDAPILSQDMWKKDWLVIVPALAFDKRGYRLGYGGGYYDRFLGAFPGFSVGVVYDALFYDVLPRTTFDRKISLIVSERRVIVPDA